ncbi:MAG: SIMPL domain-containing protein [Abditibacteriaceae bacterium]
MYKMKTERWILVLGVLSMMMALPSMAKADKSDNVKPERTLTVSGQAEVMATPDRANINLGAEAQENDAASATAKVNSIMNRALVSIKKLGIKDDAIQTTQVNLYPVYANLRSNDLGPAKVVAYRATNSVQISVDDLSLISRVLDAANAAGANVQNGVNFELRDDTVTKAGALRKAAAEARTKAQSLADALGVRLVEISSVSEGGVNVIYPRAYGGAMMMAADSASTPIQSGQITISANISLTYVISPR